jgi:hypothetical protein
LYPEWSQTLKDDYMSGRKQVAEALLAKKKQPGADLPKVLTLCWSTHAACALACVRKPHFDAMMRKCLACVCVHQSILVISQAPESFTALAESHKQTAQLLCSWAFLVKSLLGATGTLILEGRKVWAWSVCSVVCVTLPRALTNPFPRQYVQRGNAPQGFLMQWRNANRSLNPYSTVDQKTVAPLKAKKK